MGKNNNIRTNGHGALGISEEPALDDFFDA
jgi:hypothetical protein